LQNLSFSAKRSCSLYLPALVWSLLLSFISFFALHGIYVRELILLWPFLLVILSGSKTVSSEVFQNPRGTMETSLFSPCAFSGYTSCMQSFNSCWRWKTFISWIQKREKGYLLTYQEACGSAEVGERWFTQHQNCTPDGSCWAVEARARWKQNVRV
jgi:hypothetical protein